MKPRRCLLLALALALLSGAALAYPGDVDPPRPAPQPDLGEAAPEWLTAAESYAVGYHPGEWDALAQSRVPFLTHCPVNREFFARCHALGIRCLPYVTFYQGFAGQTYEGVNLQDHPDFIAVDAQGRFQRSGFWDSEDAKNMYTTCPNVQAYQDAMLAWVEQIMQRGGDGVFVDNLARRTPCFGPQFGKHAHIPGDPNQAFALLLKRVRAVVKRYKPDGAVLGNSANPTTLPREFWTYLDADMLESYICTWVSKDRWFDWRSRWDRVGKELQPYLRAGKQVQALSYLGHTPYGVREDALFCFASARLAGFVWNGGRPLSDPETADLYRLRLGKPLTGEREANGLHYRVFEAGLVAVNPDREKAATLPLAPPVPTRRLIDLSGGGARSWRPYADGGYRSDPANHRRGTRSIACTLPDPAGSSGAFQGLELNQSEPAPLVVSGWSKAQGVRGKPDADYALYVDLTYTDGTSLYGQAAPFDVGTHDWQFKTFTLRPAKPVQRLTLYALFRHKTGTVWFDDLSLREVPAGAAGREGSELLRDGGFEDVSYPGTPVDARATGRVRIPAYSGRVYLFAPDTKDELAADGLRLQVRTQPALGAVHFRVDGFDYWTHSGRWTTEYVLGPAFGTFQVFFARPGKHTLEIVDTVPADVKRPRGYGTPERLGQFMDPSNPTRPSGKKFKFRAWQGHGPAPHLEVDLTRDTTLTALFEEH